MLTSAQIYEQGFRNGYTAARFSDWPASEGGAAYARGASDPVTAFADLVSYAVDAEQGAREYAPGELLSKELNTWRSPEQAWKQYNVGVSDGVRIGGMARLELDDAGRRSGGPTTVPVAQFRQLEREVLARRKKLAGRVANRVPGPVSEAQHEKMRRYAQALSDGELAGVIESFQYDDPRAAGGSDEGYYGFGRQGVLLGVLEEEQGRRHAQFRQKRGRRERRAHPRGAERRQRNRGVQHTTKPTREELFGAMDGYWDLTWVYGSGDLHTPRAILDGVEYAPVRGRGWVPTCSIKLHHKVLAYPSNDEATRQAQTFVMEGRRGRPLQPTTAGLVANPKKLARRLKRA